MSVSRPQRARFKLRSILLVIYLLVLIAPIGSIYGFRLYENELVRQTEIELIAQGSFISAAYKQGIQARIKSKPGYGLPAEYRPIRRDEKYNFIFPEVDVGSATIHPPRPDAVEAQMPDEPIAATVGKIIFPMVDEATLTTLSGVRITDYRGMVVAGREEVGMSLAHVEEVEQALKGKYNSRLRQRISKHEPPALTSISRGTGIRLFVAMPILNGDRVLGVVLLSRSPRTILQGLQSEQRRMMVAAAAMIMITVLLALLTSLSISRPIHALIRQTQRVKEGERDVTPIMVPVTQELALLSENISRMADTIAERSDYIRNFAMHVSHEFKTPLTSIQGAIELIHEHQDSMTPEEFSRFLSNIRRDTERLKNLVSRLLELARADVAKPRAESCDLAALLGELRQYYRGKMDIVGTEIALTPLPLPQDIARTILGNLIENSLQHGASTITIVSTQTAQELRLTLTDNGKGISPANAERLFTPFFTTRRDHGGTGLGLVMIRSLLLAYRGTIRSIPRDGGACFEVTLPL